MKICALIPTLDNPHTVRAVVEALRALGLPAVVVDDGSGPEGRAACAALARGGLADVVHHPQNRGKGAACRTGFARAQQLGYTHAFQIDADGQHDLAAVPAFVRAAEQHPDALILSYPEYDATAPRHRMVARQITHFWVGLEVGGREVIKDGLIGFRIYPLAAVHKLRGFGTGMEFDVDIAVRLVRQGVTPINLPVKVRYRSKDEGGVSHFRPVRDNLRLAWMHSRLCTLGCMRWTFRRLWPFGRRAARA
ncbi:MAG: glycosyltransferase family 2 protein [Planctomycetes bacterium]|nr:glycosyltransferase family 2 protein [Planctomycetota bacterium]